MLVTSHLLGELERVCDHVIVIDGGRLLRSSAIAEFTHATESITVEVEDGAEQLAARLAELGQTVTPHGRLLAGPGARSPRRSTPSATPPPTRTSA